MKDGVERRVGVAYRQLRREVARHFLNVGDHGLAGRRIIDRKENPMKWQHDDYLTVEKNYTLITGQGASRIIEYTLLRNRPRVRVALPRPITTRSAL